jgi:uncharacterized metal-binding protein (TIGR02443 family)
VRDAPIKRFIAGAVCPRCAAQDRIRSWEAEGRLHRECVACGFEDSQATDPAVDALPRGKHDVPRPKAPSTAQPIRFYPRPKKSGD